MVELDPKQKEGLEKIRKWIVRERLSCPTRTVRVKLTAEAAELYLAECPATPPQTDDPLEISKGQHALHAVKLAAGWSLADEDPQVHLGDLQTALRMVRQAHDEALPHLRKLCEGPVRPPDFEQRLSEMVEKVRDKGSVNRRALFRSYSNQKVAIHQPVLDAAVERGLIIEDDGMLRAFKLTDSASAGDSDQTEGADGTEPKNSETSTLQSVADQSW